MSAPPIAPGQLEQFARELGLTQAILVGWAPGGTTHVVTWGSSLTDSAQAAQGGNFVKKALGFPECDCMALSPRVAQALRAQEDRALRSDATREYSGTEAVHGCCGVDCLACAAGAPRDMSQRERLTPILAQLDAAGQSPFLDLCELLLMLSERIGGSIKWNHPRVLVHVRKPSHAARPPEAK